MQTQRDRVHAYGFLMGRMSSALVSGDPSPAEPPERGHRFGLFAGLAIGVLVGVGFWVYGLVVPGGNTAWRTPGALVVEKETGNRYVYVDGVLRPTLNHASALLRQGGQAKVQMVSKASLADVPHGPPIGIADAPDSVPPAADLVTGPWLLCLDPGAGAEPSMSMVLGGAAAADPVAGGRYVLVRAPDGTRHVVLDGVRHRVGHEAALVALGVPALPVPTAPGTWLAQLPEGPALEAAEIQGAGNAGPAVAGRPSVVGQVFRQRLAAGGDQFWVAREDGLAPITATEAALLSVAARGSSPTDIDAPALASARRSSDTTLLDRLPAVAQARPAPGLGSGAACLVQTPSGAEVTSAVVTVGAEHAGRPVRDAAGATLRPGSGMLAAAVPVPAGQRKPDRYLITDRGVKYPIADDDSVTALGYGGVVPTPVPDVVLSALPTGPTLSRSAVGVRKDG
ncbi:type VII secretion protein EccB [Saccharothrix australiensis]|uniref:Type VII secretion protein EccB n=1 Tax=Saccharothrix australiensis TaxID=2072 RepID=A0A495W4X8_9PSEU|nr:type VII secretion protein EccB [Saccharothrix australiensis]RKT56741.1 type VII secretion protein EccB [Saccharothrix australiensis]